jgi:DNA-directed RNA polymerase specialized sigma24 family protein
VHSLRSALRSLSSAHRLILAEVYLNGRSEQETAQHLDVPIGTVKSRTYYAIRALRHAIAQPT